MTALQVLQVLQIEIRTHAISTSPAPRLSREPRSPARCPKTEGTNSRTQERHSSTAEIPHTSTHLSHEQSNRFPEPDAGTALAKTHPHLTHEQVRTAGRRNGRDTHPAEASQKAVEGKGSSLLNGRSGITPVHARRPRCTLLPEPPTCKPTERGRGQPCSIKHEFHRSAA